MDADKLQVVPKTDEPAAVAPGLLARLSDLKDYMIADPYPDFRGWKVELPDGRRVGKVSDLIVDTNEMVVKYMEVKVDDDVLVPRDPFTAATGEVYVLVPVGAARLADDEDAIIVDRLPKAGIENAPRFERGAPTPEQERQIRDYYEPATRTADQRDGGLFDQRRFWGQRRAERGQSPYLTRGRSEAGSTATPVAAEVVVDAVVVEKRVGQPGRSRPAR
jgi:sporulation protein YlmC with PRC-barrel domain